MWWHYLLVFLGAVLVDCFPFPLLPAFTVMVFFQIKFDLNVWLVIASGVAGSVVGRYILTIYIRRASDKLLKEDKKEECEYLGKKMKQNKWKGHLFIFTYCLLPLPTIPLFLAAGVAKLRTRYVMPGFILGKAVKDTAAVLLGDFAAKNAGAVFSGATSWKAIVGIVAALLIIFAFMFLNWKELLRNRKVCFKFNIWK